MMTSLFCSVLFSLCLLSTPFFSNANAHAKLGFTTYLIHRDSPKSPFYNPKETSFQRVRNAINRSVNRVAHYTNLSDKNTLLEAKITLIDGEYLMDLSVGTPPFQIMAVADTGSDLLWTQCEPCVGCKLEAPLFDPKASSTYINVPFSSSQCKALKRATSPSPKDDTCLYHIKYGDGSYTEGNVANETLTLGSPNNIPVQLKSMIIGCGHKTDVKFSKKGSGIVGLGGGPASLISQLRDTIDGKFSYCLVSVASENDLTSKINFGTNAIVRGPGAYVTPLIRKIPESYYHLTLKAISVGSKIINYQGSYYGTAKGNIVIDSGTPVTYLPTEMYSKLEDVVASSINAQRETHLDDDLNLCYRAAPDLKFPVITIHFDEADVKLDSSNAFVKQSEDLVCFAFDGTGSIPIYGSYAQMNFLVGYDTVSKTVSFKPMDCAMM